MELVSLTITNLCGSIMISTLHVSILSFFPLLYIAVYNMTSMTIDYTDFLALNIRIADND